MAPTLVVLCCALVGLWWLFFQQGHFSLGELEQTSSTLVNRIEGAQTPLGKHQVLSLRSLFTPRGNADWILGGPHFGSREFAEDAVDGSRGPLAASCAVIGVWAPSDPASYLLLDEISRVVPVASESGCSVFTVLLGLGQSVDQARQSLAGWNVSVPTFFDGEYRLWTQLEMNGRSEILLVDLESGAVRRRWDLSAWGTVRDVKPLLVRSGVEQGTPETTLHGSSVDLASTLYAETSFPARVVERPEGIYALNTVAHQVQRFDPHGVLVWAAGNGSPGYRDGDLNTAQFRLPVSATWSSGDAALVVADIGNRALRKIDLEKERVTSLTLPEGLVPTHVVDTVVGLLVYSSVTSQLYLKDGGTADSPHGFHQLPLPDPTFFPSDIAASTSFPLIYLFDYRSKKLTAYDLGQREFRHLRTFDGLDGFWRMVALSEDRLAFFSSNGGTTVVLYDVREDVVLRAQIDGTWSPASYLSHSQDMNHERMMQLVDPLGPRYCSVPLDLMASGHVAPTDCQEWTQPSHVGQRVASSVLNAELTLKQSVANRLRLSLRPPKGWRFSAKDVHTLALPDGRLIRWFPDADDTYQFRSPDQPGVSAIEVSATICEQSSEDFCEKIKEIWDVDVRKTATSSALFLDKRL